MTTIEAKFHRKLNDLLLEIRKRAESQFIYNLSSNVPAKILTIDETPQHAINNGLVSAISKMNGYGTHESLLFAHHVLEDVNAHSEARELVKFIPEYQ